MGRDRMRDVTVELRACVELVDLAGWARWEAEVEDLERIVDLFPDVLRDGGTR